MPQNYDVFISYAREDLERVKPWVQELKDGGLSAFFDMESLLGGGKWQGEIVEAIDSAKLVILFVSRSSLTSEFVPKELALAVEGKKNILPVFLEATEVRGQLAFCIAGLQRVLAHGPEVNVRQILLTMQPKLREFGVEWVNPSQLLGGVKQSSRQIPDEVGGGKNVRKTREPVAQTAPLRQPDERQPVKSRAWIVLVLIVLAGAGVAFFSPDWISRVAEEIPPVKPVEAVIPQAVPLSLEEEAQELAVQYYLAANRSADDQVALLADALDYLGHSGWSPIDVKADLAAYAKKWPRLEFEVLAKPPLSRIIEPDKVVECEVPLRCTSENAVVTSSTTFTGRLRMQLFDGNLKITAVSEVPGTRKNEPLKFHSEGQKEAVMGFINRAVMSGNTKAGMKPEEIAAMYVKDPDYFGRTTTHEEIINQTQSLINRWEQREYRIMEEPVILSGLGTPTVEVKVGLSFEVSSPSRGGKPNEGWVRSVYEIQFSGDGTPLIRKHAEAERGT